MPIEVCLSPLIFSNFSFSRWLSSEFFFFFAKGDFSALVFFFSSSLEMGFKKQKEGFEHGPFDRMNGDTLHNVIAHDEFEGAHLADQ